MLATAATELFQQFLQHPDLTWTHNNTGCESRADLMAELAVDQGLEPSKIWIQIAPGTEGTLGIYLNESRTEFTFCKYHVAVVIDGQIFDPAFFDAPVSREAWEDRLSSRCREYDCQTQVIESDWRNFYGPVQMIYAREGALEKRAELLELARDLNDPTVFDGVMAKARGDWVDSLRGSDPAGFERIHSSSSYSPFGLWFRMPQENDRLERWLHDNPMYFGLPSEDVLATVDFTNRLAALEVRKHYWRHVFDLFAVLSRRRDELLDGTNSKALLFQSLWGNEAEEHAEASAEWFSPGGHNEWARFGVDY